MTRIYTAHGTPMDIAKREAKRLQREQGVQLSAAQHAYAQSHGYQSWGDLASKAIEIDEEVEENLTFTRKHGQDQVWFCIGDAVDHLIEQKDRTHIPLRLTRDLNVGQEEGSVLHVLSLVHEDEVNPDFSEPFQPQGDATGEDWDEALFGLEEGRAGHLIALLNASGLFDLPIERVPHDFDHEAILTLEMRKRGLLVGERVLFNTGDVKAQGEPDFDRRCFTNLLSDGDVIFTNASALIDEMVWRVLPRAEYEVLKTEMEAELGAEAYTTYKGEAWMFERVLKNEVEQQVEPA